MSGWRYVDGKRLDALLARDKLARAYIASCIAIRTATPETFSERVDDALALSRKLFEAHE